MSDHAAALLLVDEMKRRGVRAFQIGDVHVEFATVAAPEPTLKSDKGAPDADVCGCGHSLSDHVNGLCCRNDCSPDKCSEVK
jgi:hypothetical protein